MELKRWRHALLALPVAGLALALGACNNDNGTNSNGAVSTTAVTVTPVSGPTATTFTATGQITTSGKATVTYRWERDDGTMSDVQTLTFDNASTQSVTTTWDPGGCSTSSRTRWIKLDVLTPNVMTSTQTNFTQDASANCP
jgi:hypothetical protein